MSWGLPWAAPDHGLLTCAWGGLHTGGRVRAGQRASTNSINSRVNVTVKVDSERLRRQMSFHSEMQSWPPVGDQQVDTVTPISKD